MKAAVVVLVASLLAGVSTAFDPATEMWSPLFVALGPLLAYMLWPRRDDAAAGHHAPRKVA